MNSEERKRIIAEYLISFNYLKRFNTATGVLHLVQGIIMPVLGLQLEWSRDIYTFYLKLEIVNSGPTAMFNAVPNPQVFFTIGYLGAILASFPLISAIAHFVIAYPKTKAITSV